MTFSLLGLSPIKRSINRFRWAGRGGGRDTKSNISRFHISRCWHLWGGKDPYNKEAKKVMCPKPFATHCRYMRGTLGFAVLQYFDNFKLELRYCGISKSAEWCVLAFWTG